MINIMETTIGLRFVERLVISLEPSNTSFHIGTRKDTDLLVSAQFVCWAALRYLIPNAYQVHRTAVELQTVFRMSAWKACLQPVTELCSVHNALIQLEPLRVPRCSGIS